MVTKQLFIFEFAHRRLDGDQLRQAKRNATKSRRERKRRFVAKSPVHAALSAPRTPCLPVVCLVVEGDSHVNVLAEVGIWWGTPSLPDQSP